MFEQQIQELNDKIARAKSILIFGHKNPDGDSLGSVLGLRRLIADNFEKNADIIYDGNLPFQYNFISGRADFIYAEKAKMKNYDLVCTLDIAAQGQMGDLQKAFFDAAKDSVKIDHHKTEEDFAGLNIVKADYVATAEIIYEIARELNWKISSDVATCLYLGIYTDTDGFNFIDNSNAFRVAAGLVDLGANARAIVPALDVSTKGDIIAQATALANTEFFYGGKLAVVSIPNNLYKKLDSGETVILMRLRDVKGVKALVVLKEAKSEEITVSLRSNTLPVRVIAEKLGGGGHDFASGAKLFTNLQSAKQTVLELFDGVL